MTYTFRCIPDDANRERLLRLIAHDGRIDAAVDANGDVVVGIAAATERAAAASVLRLRWAMRLDAAGLTFEVC